jgi:hypothetical protein
VHGPYACRKMRGAPVGQIIPGCGSDDCVAQAMLPHSINQVLRLLRVHWLGLTMINCSETTIARTGTAQDEEGRRLLPEALPDVRAFSLLTDCCQ